MRWRSANSQVHETTLGTLDGSRTSWQLSAPTPLATALPLNGLGQSVTAQIVFDPEDWGGYWTIYDVYVDPRMR